MNSFFISSPEFSSFIISSILNSPSVFSPIVFSSSLNSLSVISPYVFSSLLNSSLINSLSILSEFDSPLNSSEENSLAENSSLSNIKPLVVIDSVLYPGKINNSLLSFIIVCCSKIKG